MASNDSPVEGRPGQPRDRRKAYIALALAACVIVAGLVAPESAELSRKGLVSLSILVVAVLLWVTEAVNSNVTALVILALLPALGALSYQDTFIGLGNRMIWRLVGVMVITIGLNRSGLDRRMALHALRLARGNVYAMLFLMVASGADPGLLWCRCRRRGPACWPRPTWAFCRASTSGRPATSARSSSSGSRRSRS